jgi:hypothetical protein
MTLSSYLRYRRRSPLASLSLLHCDSSRIALRRNACVSRRVAVRHGVVDAPPHDLAASGPLVSRARRGTTAYCSPCRGTAAAGCDHCRGKIVCHFYHGSLFALGQRPSYGNPLGGCSSP